MSRIVFTSSKIQITTQTNNQNEKKSQLFSSKILCVAFISQDQSSLQCFKPSHFEFILFFSVTAPWVCHTNYHIRISISLLPIERTHTHVVRKCFLTSDVHKKVAAWAETRRLTLDIQKLHLHFCDQWRHTGCPVQTYSQPRQCQNLYV